MTGKVKTAYFCDSRRVRKRTKTVKLEIKSVHFCLAMVRKTHPTC